LPGVVTNSGNLSNEEISKQYTNLCQVEEAFRITKHDLKVRPIYHWTPSRVRAHIAISYLAFCLVRHLEYRVSIQYKKLSPKSIVHSLSKVQASILRDFDGKRYVLPSEFTQDAKKIYQFMGLETSITPYRLESKEITEIKKLLSLREKLVSQRSGYKSTLCEYKHFLIRKENVVIFSIHEKMIKELSKQILKIEMNIDKLIKSNDKLKKQFDLINSIKGVGPQTALFMIAFTDGFTRFETWRKFASYCGVAPFPHRSGTSVRGKTKVSNLANKKIKSLLDMCAKSAIQSNPEMKIYYERRTTEGKPKMSTINIIRNKLLSRIFAVVKRETPYVNTLAYSN